MKVLVTASTFPRWENDTEPRFIFELSRRLAAKFDILVLSPYAKGAQTREVFGGIRIRRYKYLPFNLGTLAYDGGILPKLRKSRFNYLQIPFFLLFQFLFLQKLVRAERIEIVHAHWLVPQGFVAAFYKKLFAPRLKLVVTIHGGDLYGLQNPIGRWLKKFTLRHADSVTVVSNAIARELTSYGYHGVAKVFPMGIDTTKFSPARKDESLRKRFGIEGAFLLFVGRLAEKKGVRYLLQALPTVLKEYPKTKLVIVGDGPLGVELKVLARDLKIEHNVIFTGSLPYDDLPRYFATADLFIGPSIVVDGGDREGFGLVFAEALSSGTLVIATDLPAISDIISDKETGFIVPEKNPGEISRVVIMLLKDQQAYCHAKARGIEHAKKFDWESVTENYGHLYESMVGEG